MFIVQNYGIVLALDHVFRRERGPGKIHFPCSAHHEHRISHLTRLIYTLAICVTIVPGADITDKRGDKTSLGCDFCTAYCIAKRPGSKSEFCLFATTFDTANSSFMYGCMQRIYQPGEVVDPARHR